MSSGIWLIIAVLAFFTVTGITGCLILLVRQRRTTAALEENRRKLAKATDNIPGIVYQFELLPDGSTRFPFVNDWCLDMFGIPPDVLLKDGASLIDLIHDEDRRGFEESVALSVQTLAIWQWEGRLRAVTGEWLWFQGISKPDPQENGDVVWNGIFFDISARRQAEIRAAENERLLREPSNMLRSVLENIPAGVFWKDRNLKYMGGTDSSAILPACPIPMN